MINICWVKSTGSAQDKCNESILYDKKNRFKLFQCDHMIYIYSIPSQFLLPSHLQPKYITSPNKTLTCVLCVCGDLTSFAYIYDIN